MWGNIAITFLLAFITSYVFTPYTVRLARKVKALDRPKDRKVHKRVMPRLGGIAIVLGFLTSAIYLIITMSIEKNLDIFANKYYIKLVGFFIGIIILEIFCYLDDKKGIRPIVKLFGQLLAAIIVVASGVVIDTIVIGSFGTIISNELFLKIFTIIWIVAITNAINLIDGLDGLSTGVSLISAICLMLIFILNSSPVISIILATALAGSLLGFLPFNFNPARTFMGDTGSNFIGFTLAVISIIGTAKTYTAIIIIAPLLVLALPIFDTSFAIIRRIIREKSLIDRGYTQKQAVYILYGISATFGLFAIILLESGIWKAISFALLVLAIVAIGYKDIFRVKKKIKNTPTDKI